MSKSLPNPKTRIEHYLNKLAKGETTTLPKPVTRVECYLDEIANSGGGGGGSDLPAVTSDDNGKVLKVINGAWDKGEASGGGNDFLVEFSLVMSGDEWTVTTETSVDDIIAAKTTGKNVKCKAVNRMDIDEGQYMLNEMFGDDYTYAEMVIEGTTVKMLHFVLYWFNSEKWVQCDLIGGYSIEEGQTSEDFWMFQPQESD